MRCNSSAVDLVVIRLNDIPEIPFFLALGTEPQYLAGTACGPRLIAWGSRRQ